VDADPRLVPQNGDTDKLRQAARQRCSGVQPSLQRHPRNHSRRHSQTAALQSGCCRQLLHTLRPSADADAGRCELLSACGLRPPCWVLLCVPAGTACGRAPCCSSAFRPGTAFSFVSWGGDDTGVGGTQPQGHSASLHLMLGAWVGAPRPIRA
jgi:hypothetical protein